MCAAVLNEFIVFGVSSPNDHVYVSISPVESPASKLIAKGMSPCVRFALIAADNGGGGGCLRVKGKGGDNGLSAFAEYAVK